MKRYRVRLWNGTILFKTNDKKALYEVIERLNTAKEEFRVEVMECSPTS